MISCKCTASCASVPGSFMYVTPGQTPDKNDVSLPPVRRECYRKALMCGPAHALTCPSASLICRRRVLKSRLLLEPRYLSLMVPGAHKQKAPAKSEGFLLGIGPGREDSHLRLLRPDRITLQG